MDRRISKSGRGNLEGDAAIEGANAHEAPAIPVRKAAGRQPPHLARAVQQQVDEMAEFVLDRLALQETAKMIVDDSAGRCARSCSLKGQGIVVPRDRGGRSRPHELFSCQNYNTRAEVVALQGAVGDRLQEKCVFPPRPRNAIKEEAVEARTALAACSRGGHRTRRGKGHSGWRGGILHEGREGVTAVEAAEPTTTWGELGRPIPGQRLWVHVVALRAGGWDLDVGFGWRSGARFSSACSRRRALQGRVALRATMISTFRTFAFVLLSKDR